jgi:hypothetical protein
VPLRPLLASVLLAATVGVAAFVGTSGSGGAAGGTYTFGLRDQAPRVTLRPGEIPADFSGGPITAADGETVTVYAQDEILAVDPAANQHWADVLAGLLHGSELSTVTLFVATLDRVHALCGTGALGCYSERTRSIVAVGQDQPTITARAVVTHEYGHHVAGSRDNFPWPAIAWGTKRWASYLNVCRRAKAGELAPGDESRLYELNPGEAFAEDYRLLNERRAGLPETFWGVVSQSLYPDQTALDLLALDVTSPWAGNTSSTFTTRFGPRAIGRGYRISTSDDGNFTATLTSPAGSRFTLRVVDLTSGNELASVATPARVKTVQLSICGERSLQIKVRRVSGSGTITLTVSKP